MNLRPFLRWPDRRLRTPAATVGMLTDAHREIWEDMLAAMYAMPGYGLAAPQIGVMQRLCVVDCSPSRDRPVRMADPEILTASDETFEWDEASPNLPGISARIARPRRIEVAFVDAAGIRVRRAFSELWATSVQHQIDHLNGRMFFDRLGRVKREMLLKKAAKSGRAG